MGRSRSSQDLRYQIGSIDRRGYPALKGLRGAYDFGGFELSVDHVQGDPFAAPSKLSVFVPHWSAGFPRDLSDKPWKRVALEDHLVRRFGAALARYSFKVRGSGKSGLLGTSRPGQEVLERTACMVDAEGVTLRFEAGFPANGRSVAAGELERMLLDYVPRCVREALLFANLPEREVRAAVELAEDQHAIREELGRRGLVCFVADGSVLPRESGVSSRPMRGALPFASPASLRVELDLPHRGRVAGMGLPRGVTVIAGGGYHGKSTLLKAIETGVYDHIAGDGREYVATDATAVKLRAEDGRSVRNVDISPFIGELPNRVDTTSFSTDDASGSTSQAAAAVEAVEAGCRAFLLDEDTSAANFMVRDALMQAVVSRDHEPITPFVERVRDLYERAGVSSVIVAGSSGAFFSVADTVLQMDRYEALDITERAHRVSAEFAAAAAAERCEGEKAAGVEGAAVTEGAAGAEGASGAEDAAGAEGAPQVARYGNPGRRLVGGRGGRGGDDQVDRGGRGGRGNCGGHGDRGGRDDRLKVRASGLDSLQVGGVSADVRLVEQLVDFEQVDALAQIVRVCIERGLLTGATVREAADELAGLLAREGLEALCGHGVPECGLAMPRAQEICACLNRLRGL